MEAAHLREIQDRLGFRDARPADSAALSSWLLDRALGHDKPMVLFQLACQWLLEEHLVRPGVTIVERLVATTRELAQDETYRRLTSLLTPALRDGLDAVLQPEAGAGRTPLSWLQHEATAPTPRRTSCRRTCTSLGEIATLAWGQRLG